MVEVAFTVDNQSEFYKQYFDAKGEKQKFHDLARQFFKKYDLLDSRGYYQEAFLGLQLTDKQRNRFATQIKKYPDKNGMFFFKKNSTMQKEWSKDVIANVDMHSINKQNFWWMYYIGSGKYALWDKDGVIYGYLSDNSEQDIKLADYMLPIKISEYYIAMGR